jgi:hypothetical protein
MIFGDATTSDVTGIILAAIPGVLVALLAQALSQRADARQARRLETSARAMLALEVESNRETLSSFWRTINQLDADAKDTESVEHLAGMTYGGLLTYVAPSLSTVRWDHLAPEVYGAFTAKEILALDSFYRGLSGVSELYGRLVKLNAEERAELDKDRFWYNRFADWRIVTFKHLSQTATQTLGVGNPLKG